MDADALKFMVAAYKEERDRADRLDRYLRGDHDHPYTPKNATQEYKLLAQRAVTNWLPLVVDVMAQTLYVEGYRTPEDPEDSTLWDLVWMANRMNAVQSAVHRGALSYGRSYALVLPSEEGLVAVRAYSPLRMVVAFEEPGDEVPAYALRVLPVLGKYRLSLFDDTTVTTLEVEDLDSDIRKAKVLEQGPHGAPWCPVVPFLDCPDLDGHTFGQVEPLIPIQDRINQTTFDLLVAQTYGSFRVRTISGMAIPLDEQGKPISTVELSIKRFLHSPDPDTKFGDLSETNLGGYLESLDTSVRHLAAVSQTPPHALLGQMANLSAEALVAAESGLTRKADERRSVFGQAWEHVIRLGAAILGDLEAAENTSGRVVWRDAEARSMAQTVDALGKAAQMLGIPAEALWERIPGVSLQDVERWKEMRASGDPLAQLNVLLAGAETAAPFGAPEAP